MSTGWDYRCTEDGETSNCDMNHGQGTLRDLAKAGPALVALQRSGVEDIDLDHYTPGASAALWFLRRHGDHHLELISEYGDIEPLDKACGVEHGALDSLSCQRSLGHTGKHEGRWEISKPFGEKGSIRQHQSTVRWDRPVPAC